MEPNYVTYFMSMGKNAPFVIMAVLGLTWLAGQMGAKGRTQLLMAFIFGFLIGASFQAATFGIPYTIAEWFNLFLTAALMGLMPSGFYEAMKEAANKAVSSKP